MTIKEVKNKYQSIVNDCRKAEKTGEPFLARFAAMRSLEIAQNEFEQNEFVESDIAARNEARRLYHSAWNAIAFPSGEEGVSFVSDFDESRAATGE